MHKVYCEKIKEINRLGIKLSYITVPGGYQPLHWHEELEILYPLNGEVTVTLDGKVYDLPKKQFMVMESYQVHSTYTHDRMAMFICIHISKSYMERYMPDIQRYQVSCIPENIQDENFSQYLEACKMMEHLMRLYVEDAPVFQLEAEGVVLQLLSYLIRNFSAKEPFDLPKSNTPDRERIQKVIDYVEQHFRETITLTDAAKQLCLGKEYFCRFFKKNMGISFMEYVREIRLAQVYTELIHTEAPVGEIMEGCGITNQKLFNRTFKERYGCTPLEARKNSISLT